MTHRMKNNHIVGSQSGVSLLMAILVLASITAISFSIANIVFIEIRSSSDFMRSERALYAAYAITEESLFKYSRDADFEYIGGAKQYNGVLLEASSQLESESPYIDTIAQGSSKQYDLVDADNPNGPGDYKRIEVVYRTITGSPAPLLYTFWMIDPTASNPPVLISQDILDSYGESFENSNLDLNMQYQLVLQNSSSVDITVAIYTYGPTVSTEKGLPNLGQVFVDITASYLGLTRKYETRIPY